MSEAVQPVRPVQRLPATSHTLFVPTVCSQSNMPQVQDEIKNIDDSVAFVHIIEQKIFRCSYNVIDI